MLYYNILSDGSIFISSLKHENAKIYPVENYNANATYFTTNEKLTYIENKSQNNKTSDEDKTLETEIASIVNEV